MSLKTSADVIIGGKVYTLSGYESEAYLQKVAAYINNKMSEFDSLSDYRHFPADMKSALLALNIADDYFKAKQQAEKLEEALDAENKDIYDLKHELVSLQLKIGELEKTNAVLALEQTQLKSSLEQAEKTNAALLLEQTQLKNNLDEAEKRNTEMSEQKSGLEQAEKTNAALLQERIQLKSLLEQAEKTNAALLQEQIRLKNSLDEAEKTGLELLQEQEKLEKSLEEMRVERNSSKKHKK